jgi:hypothetical protein
MAKKLVRLLLLDANVVLELHRLKLWDAVADRCELVLAGTVVGESQFIEEDGERIEIDLTPDIKGGKVRIVQVDLKIAAAFRARFKKTFLERLDAGEQESLAHLAEVERDCLICSADAIVWRTLGALALRDHGRSLEEILSQIGLGRAVDEHFTKAFRERYTAQGFAEALRGEATTN